MDRLRGWIPAADADIGDFVLFKGTGLLFKILSAFISIFDSGWRHLNWKPWHCAIIVNRYGQTAVIIEGTTPVSRTREIDLQRDDIKIHRWLVLPPTFAQVQRFVVSRVGRKYDRGVYLLTILSFFARRIGIDFPRIIDRSLTCWEMLWEFADACNQDIFEAYEYPLMPDLLRLIGAPPNG